MYFVLYGDDYLYDPRTNDRILTSLQFTASENSVNYCDFTINPDHPLYSTIMVHDMKNPIIVKEDDDIIFAGFIYELGTNFQIQGEVKCKGDLALLNEVIAPIHSTTTINFGQTVSNTISGYVTWLINYYNSQVDEINTFAMGVNEGDDISDQSGLTLDVYDHPTILECLNNLISEKGGYIRCRWENNTRYFDYVSDWTNENSQILDFGVNLLDYSKTDDGEELYTAIMPIGANIEDTYYPYSDGFYAVTDITVATNATQPMYKKSESYKACSVTSTSQIPDEDAGGKFYIQSGSDYVAPTWSSLKPKAGVTYYCSSYSTCTMYGSWATKTVSGYYVGAYNSAGQNITYLVTGNDSVKDRDKRSSDTNGPNGELTTTRDWWGNEYDTRIATIKRTPVYTTSYSTYTYTGAANGTLSNAPFYAITGDELIALGFTTKFPSTTEEFTTVKNSKSDWTYNLSKYGHFENKFYIWKGKGSAAVEADIDYCDLSSAYTYYYKTTSYSEIDTSSYTYSQTASMRTEKPGSSTGYLYQTVTVTDSTYGTSTNYYYWYPSANLSSYNTTSHVAYYNRNPQTEGWYYYNVSNDQRGTSLTFVQCPAAKVNAITIRDGFKIAKESGLVYNEEAMEKYGLICGTCSNDDSISAEELYDDAVKALEKNYEVHRTIEVKAIDMHLVNKNLYKRLNIGDYVRVRSEPHNIDAYFIVRDIDISLVDPTQSTYTLGFDPWELTEKQIARMNELYANAQASNVRQALAAGQEATQAADAVDHQLRTVAAQIAGDNILEGSRTFSSSNWSYDTNSEAITIDNIGIYTGTTPVYAWDSKQVSPSLSQTIQLVANTPYTLSFIACGKNVKSIKVQFLNWSTHEPVSVTNLTESNPLADDANDTTIDMIYDVYDETNSTTELDEAAYSTFKCSFVSQEYCDAIFQITVEWIDGSSQLFDGTWDDVYQTDPNASST